MIFAMGHINSVDMSKTTQGTLEGRQLKKRFEIFLFLCRVGTPARTRTGATCIKARPSNVGQMM